MTPTKSNKPTLFKAVEAATKRSNYPWSDSGEYTAQDYKNEGAIQLANSLLSSLPDKPMTEDEIFKIIHQVIYHGFGSGVTTTKVIEALKAANVLYVKED